MANSVVLAGELKRDAESNTGSGWVNTKLTVVTEKTFVSKKDGLEKTIKQFHNVLIWGEGPWQNYKAGNLVIVDGSIEYRSYEDKQGDKKIATQIVARTISRHGVEAVGGDDAEFGRERRGDGDFNSEDIPF